jgi:hypothetical protein
MMSGMSVARVFGLEPGLTGASKIFTLTAKLAN